MMQAAVGMRPGMPECSNKRNEQIHDQAIRNEPAWCKPPLACGRLRLMPLNRQLYQNEQNCCQVTR